MKYEPGDVVSFLRVYDTADRHQACLDGLPPLTNHLMTGRIVSIGSQVSTIDVGGNVLFVNNSDIGFGNEKERSN